MKKTPAALTIAGSDSGGGAGIQADLKTFASIGVFGTSAITCLTAQNPGGVAGIQPAPPGFVALQIRTVCAGFPITAVKTGMLYSSGIIKAVTRAVKEAGIRHLVVDPVMVATSGAKLLKDDAMAALCLELLPACSVFTPNIPEAELLLGSPIRSVDDMVEAAITLSCRFGAACVVKGGHMAGGDLRNVLCSGTTLQEFRLPRIRTRQTHGTGCTFSAAIAAHLAAGAPLAEAVALAGQYVLTALKTAPQVGKYYPLGWTIRS
jgi:hydroxymethylpyrimidine/phosphomethylpyrimidine kinase